MQLTTVASYGIIALQEMYSVSGPLSMARLAEILSEASGNPVTQVYVQQVMRGLLAAGIVTSVRGMSGGYMLANKRRQVSVHDVIMATSRAKAQTSSSSALRADIVAAKVDSRIADALKALKVKSLM